MSDDNIIEFKKVPNLSNKNTTPVEDVLKYASGKLNSCIVIGATEEGMLYVASSLENDAESYYLIGLAQKLLLDADERGNIEGLDEGEEE